MASTIQPYLDILLYHSYTAWLFTYDYLPTLFIPSLLFGLGAATYLQKTISRTSWPKFGRIFMASLWLWLLVLIQALVDQTPAQNIAYDKLNKPWRPIASGRITSEKLGLLTRYLGPAVWSWGMQIGAGWPYAYTGLIVWTDLYRGSEKVGVLEGYLVDVVRLGVFGYGVLSILMGREGLKGRRWKGVGWAVLWGAAVTRGCEAVKIC